MFYHGNLEFQQGITGMNKPKMALLATYTVMAGVYFALPGTPATIVSWVFLVLLVTHLLEFALNFKVLKAARGALWHHFIQTMLYGVLHWLPYRRASA
jgi:uncharacterized protein YhhL (DUF1145 family)